MKLPRRKFLRLAAGAAGLISFAGTAQAQDWPTRPINLVVTYAAGGAADIIARLVGPYISERLGQPVIVENVGGAGGMTGAARVAKAAADGYQIVLGTNDTHAINQTFYKKPLYDAAADFTPVALFAELPLLLVVRKDLPVNDLQEFIAYSKKNDPKLQYGSAGPGTVTHLTCVLLNSAMGTSATHVPYRGVALAMQDLIAGRIDYQCPVAAAMIPQIESKTVNAIATFTKDRSPILSSLPTAREQGLDLEASAWFGFFLPKGAQPANVRKLHDAIVATMAIPAVQERIKQVGGDLVASERRSPEYLQKFVESEIAKWAVPLKASGVTAD
jgi:tripartite-type tricarboxylate transporter receptor subunit TctC